MQTRLPFDKEDKRNDLLHLLNNISGVMIPSNAITRRPSLSLSALSDESILVQFLEIFDWVIGEIKSSNP
jgi:hypothetical protein